MDKYQDRRQAGQVLARALSTYADRDNVIVLALPRGGVPVAYEIAKSLHAPLDVFIVRKLGVPGHEELALGAIATGDIYIFNEDIIGELQVSKQQIETVIKQESNELKRRELAYRGNRPFPDLQNKIVILVDDGIATGATMRAAIKSLRLLKPKNIIVAVPVAAKEMCDVMQNEVDQFYCPLRPVSFYAVGAWYQDFSQTEDEEVYTLLKAAKKGMTHG